MKSTGISFTDAMVKAILAGKKTQTRRVVDCPDDTTSIRWVVDNTTVPCGEYTGWVIECGAPLLLPRKCPYGTVGDRLWVKQTWSPDHAAFYPHFPVVFKADSPVEIIGGRVFSPEAVREFPFKWRSPRFMPKSVARLHLELTGVRVGRLQDISDADAVAEGIEYKRLETYKGVKGYHDPSTGKAWQTAAVAYRKLWESINGPGSWDANPFVWILAFKLVTQ